MAVDTLGHLLALHVTPADAQDRAQVAALAEAVHAATDERVELAYVDAGYTGDQPERAAAERSFGWLARFRRLGRDYKRLGSSAAGLHFAAFAFVMLARLARLAIPRP